MKLAITICLVPEAARGPFVFHDGLEACCRAAAQHEFTGIEIFPAAAADMAASSVRPMLLSHGLGLAAVGTGAGFLRHGLHLVHPEAAVRQRAREFIVAIVDAAGELGAPAIIGSMQGRTTPEVPRDTALVMLAEALGDLGRRAEAHGQPLLYEPLNRYETDLINRQEEAAGFLEANGLHSVKLLCDLFHMNIEEESLAGTLVACGSRIGHVHWADSNRRAMGFGHTDAAAVVAALRTIHYSGWLSAEVFSWPSASEAADRTIASLRRHLAA
ncbi:MAG: TIM barrel protein [Pirellulales bacterium]